MQILLKSRIGQGLDRDWSGIGQGLVRGLVRDWPGIGQGIGQGLIRDWPGIGQGLVSAYINVPHVRKGLLRK